MSFIEEKQLWQAQLTNNYKSFFLGYFTDEIDAAKIYNDYALFLNITEHTNFLLNAIPGYKNVARNVPEQNKMKIQNEKSSKYIGASYDTKRKIYKAGIQCNGKTYNLGVSDNDIDCAKMYNQQALYFNNTLKTKYVLNEIENYTTIPKDFRDDIIQKKLNKKTSKYYGVSKNKHNKYECGYTLNRKKIHIGTFNTELEACEAYNKTVIELNKNGCNYKINKSQVE